MWEANHVWLIFVLVMLWTAFPPVYSAVASSLYQPLTLAAVGIILRGAGFAIRKSITGVGERRVFGAAFALSSVFTPYAFGAVAGGVASGRVPPGNAEADPVTSWVNPTSVLGGLLAVGVCAYLAAVFLCRDAERDDDTGVLPRYFRRRAEIAALAVGALALVGIVVLRQDAPSLYHGLTHRGLPLVALSAVGGLGSLWLIRRGRFVLARGAAALAVAAVIWGWGAAQYPYMLEDRLTYLEAAGARATIVGTLIALGIGAVLLVPSLYALYRFSSTAEPEGSPPTSPAA